MQQETSKTLCQVCVEIWLFSDLITGTTCSIQRSFNHHDLVKPRIPYINRVERNFLESSEFKFLLIYLNIKLNDFSHKNYC